MPTFDFACAACDTTFEASLPFGSKKLPVCASCGSKKVTKLLTPPLGIHFKGSGFYKTDSTPKEAKKTAPEPVKETPKSPPKEAKNKV